MATKRKLTMTSARKLAAGRAALELAERATESVSNFQGGSPKNPKADVWIRRLETGATSLFIARTERARHWVQTATDADGAEGAFGLGAYVIAPSDERLMADAARKAGLRVTT